MDRHNPFLVVAVAYLAAGLLAVTGRLATDVGLVTGLPRLRWTMIHLVTIGAMTEVLFGALPHLVGARTGSRPNLGRRWFQWLALTAGFPLVLVGMTTATTVVTVTGATLVLLALGALLGDVWQASGGGDADVLRFFRTGPWYLVVGITMAFGLLLGLHGPGGWFGTIEAHVHANVWGFLALVVAGALLDLVPASLDSDLRYPGLKPVTYWGITLGAAGLVAGPWFAQHTLTFTGLAVYVVGTGALLANVVGTYRAAGSSRDSRLAHVLGGYLWLALPVPFAPFVLLFPDLLPGALIERTAINGLVFGWMLQLAMAYLPAVLRAHAGTDDLVDVRESVGSAARPGWVGVVTANVGMALLWLRVAPVTDATRDLLGTAGFAFVAVAWAVFLVALWRTLVGGDERPDPVAGQPAPGDRPTPVETTSEQGPGL